MWHSRPGQDLDDALELIGEAALREDLWDEVPNALARLFRAKTVAIYFQNERQRSGQLEQVETVFTEGYDDSTLDSYARHYHALNPYHRHPELGVPNRIITDEWLPADLSAGEREYLEDWVRPQGVHHLMGQMLNRRAAGTLFFVTWRGSGVGHFSEGEKHLFNRISRATDRAIDVAERLHTAETAFSAAAAQLGMQGVGVIFLAADGRVTDCNAAADACLAGRDGLVLCGGRLEALYPADRSVFQRFVDGLLKQDHVLSANRTEIVLRRALGRSSLRIEGVRVGGYHARFGSNRHGSAILLLHLPVLSSRDPARLRKAWGLTPAEARLALLLLEPVPLREAAQRLGITHETARSHLKALFAKTGTHGQTELALRLMSEVP
jgi:DNA-binding CsgD family transcriptional regulator